MGWNNLREQNEVELTWRRLGTKP